MALVDDISKLSSRETLSQYLEQNLGYCSTDVSYEPSQLDIPPKPSEIIYSIHLLSDYDKLFQTYLFETTSLTRTTIRSILEPFYRHHPMGDYLFIFTKDYSQLAFVNPQRIFRPEKPVPMLQLRILPVEPANVYHTDLEVLQGISLTPTDQCPEAIRRKHEEAFNVERVTKQFFNTYKEILNQLKGTLVAQGKGSEDQAHGFAQQLLNRLMFLYFLQKKSWLKWGDSIPDKRYMRNLWQKYSTIRFSDNSFYRVWLSSLFFYAFNNRLSLLPLELPGDIRASFLNMPFLNGGLFAESDLDRLGFDVPDDIFATLFDRNIDGTSPGFLERYNFTIQESLPLEVEVAVDPEMLGRVYESLINEEDRHQAGIFYTPRIEIDYMCRLSLMEYLHEATGFSRDVLIPIVMAPASEDGRSELSKLGNEELSRLRAALDSVKVVDPAVGSGSFLVGMMNVLVQLYRAIAECKGHHENEFALKKRIISQNLFGVDVKDWAVRVCELRLWLSLIIESEESQMDIYGQPLLPNLTFKARQGDSLVEEIADMPLSLRADYAYMPPSLKRRIQHIVDKKAEYFRGDRSVSQHDIEYLEHELLREIVDNKIKAIDTDIRKLEAPQKQSFQTGLEQIRGSFIDTQEIVKGLEEAQAKIQPQIAAMRQEKERLQKVASTIGKKGEKDYFLWDIDFAEVFLEKGGFDICIGNPPYVRQEEIGPPLENAEDYDPGDWREMKRSYKEQLERATRTHWGSAITRIDKKSDLYVYFYYQGLNLLRPGGTFCFINSNSWLDVGYGASLQQFLLKNIAVQQVIDNQARRSFKESDVNTIIVLLKRPKDGNWEALKDNTPKFIAYRQPFESAVNAENLLLEEWADSVQSTKEFRVYPIRQEDLWLDGLEVSEETETPSMELGTEHGKYTGGKWGGKYLRAPDIFFTILEKGEGKLVRLGAIAEVLPGCYSGVNDFFYLTRAEAQERGIESQFLTPLLRTPQQITTLNITEPVKTFVLSCQLSKEELRARKYGNVLKYIEWGETQVTRKRQKTEAGVPWPQTETVRRRKPGWWAIPQHGLRPARLFMLYVVNERFICPYSDQYLVSDRCFHRVFPKNHEDEYVVFAMLNSTLSYLFVSMLGRVNLGLGAMKFETTDADRLLILNPSCLSEAEKEEIIRAFRPVASREAMPIAQEIESRDRQEFDHMLLSILGLPESALQVVYHELVEQVRQRILKSRAR